MFLSRRSLLASVALAPLAGCSAFTTPVTDYLGEAASVFTAGNVALTAVTVLVQTGVIAKAQAQGWQAAVNAVAAQFATLDANIDRGTTLTQAMVDAAMTALNSFQVVAKPAVTTVTPAQANGALAAHKATLPAHPKLIAI